MSTELLAQLNALIANAEANQVEAELWRETRRLMIEAGYGPRITPAQIVVLVPNVHGIHEIVTATQEVVPAPAGSKFFSPQAHRGGRTRHYGPRGSRPRTGADRQ